jgi:hypothetical protein
MESDNIKIKNDINIKGLVLPGVGRYLFSNDVKNIALGDDTGNKRVRDLRKEKQVVIDSLNEIEIAWDRIRYIISGQNEAAK